MFWQPKLPKHCELQSLSHSSASASLCNPPFQSGWQPGFRCPHCLNTLIHRYFWFIKGNPSSQPSYSFTKTSSNHLRICFPQQIKPQLSVCSHLEVSAPVLSTLPFPTPLIDDSPEFQCPVSSSHPREPCQDSPQGRKDGQEPLCIPMDEREGVCSKGSA